jgi:hypothetical protein
MRHKFDFEVTLDPRKHGSPYAAKLVWKDGKLQREFYDLKRQYGKKEVTVWGTFEAEDGDVIEMREGSSWKNDYRNWYLVLNGELHFLTDIDDSEKKRVVIDYISGDITMEEMVAALKVKIDKVETTKTAETTEPKMEVI